MIRQNRCQAGDPFPQAGKAGAISQKPVYGQPVNSDRLLDTSAFLVTYLVKLPPSRLPGSQRDSFVARCGRTMTQLGENHNLLRLRHSPSAWTYFSDTCFSTDNQRS